MNTDTRLLAGLLALTVVIVAVVTVLGHEVPDLLEYVAVGLAGALTGATLPARKRKEW